MRLRGRLHAGRSTERPVLSEEEIERNVRGIRRILEQLIGSGNGAGPAPTILNNLVHTWSPLASSASLNLQPAALPFIPQCRGSPQEVHVGRKLTAAVSRQDWFKDVGLLSFLRDVGKFARVGTMLSRDAVKSRMELDNEGISFTE